MKITVVYMLFFIPLGLFPDGGNLSCVLKEASMCFNYTGYTDYTEVKKECDSVRGTVANATCSTSEIVGKCINTNAAQMHQIEAVFYYPRWTKLTLKQRCEKMGGIFSDN